MLETLQKNKKNIFRNIIMNKNSYYLKEKNIPLYTPGKGKIKMSFKETKKQTFSFPGFDYLDI